MLAIHIPLIRDNSCDVSVIAIVMGLWHAYRLVHLLACRLNTFRTFVVTFSLFIHHVRRSFCFCVNCVCGKTRSEVGFLQISFCVNLVKLHRNLFELTVLEMTLHNLLVKTC